MTLTARENYLQAISFGQPEYMPRGEEDLFYSIHVQDIMSKKSFTDEWQVSWIQELPETSPFPTRCPLASLDRLSDYTFPNPDQLFDKFGEEKQRIRSAKEQGRIVTGNYFYFLYERAWALMGMENFLIALLSEPDAVRQLLHEIARYSRRVFENFLELGVDAISFSEDLGTQKALMFSPHHFHNFFLPEYQFAFEPVLQAKKIINFHSCGRVDEIADDLAAIQVTVLNPLQARANNLAAIKAKTQGRMALQGGVDSHLLLTGTPEQVAQETRRVIGILKPGGGYVLTPDQGFPNYPPANIEAMYREAKRLGSYDLSD